MTEQESCATCHGTGHVPVPPPDCYGGETKPCPNGCRSTEARIRDLQEMIGGLKVQLNDMRRERDDLQKTFDMQWKAEMRGVTMWQEATGRTMTMPDKAGFVCWLLRVQDTLVETLKFSYSDNVEAVEEIDRLLKGVEDKEKDE